MIILCARCYQPFDISHSLICPTCGIDNNSPNSCEAKLKLRGSAIWEEGKRCISHLDSTCFFCGQEIKKGDPIFWHRVKRNPRLVSGWHHKYACENCHLFGYPPLN